MTVPCTHCEYKIWRDGTLQPCGKNGKELSFPEITFVKRRLKCRTVCLCEEHKEFVIDCVTPPINLDKQKTTSKIIGFGFNK